MENGWREWHHFCLWSTGIFIAKFLFKINLYLLPSKRSVFSVNAGEIFTYLIRCWWNVPSAPLSLLLFSSPAFDEASGPPSLWCPCFPWPAHYLPLAWLGDSAGPRLPLPTCAVQVPPQSSRSHWWCWETWSTFSRDVGQERAEALLLLREELPPTFPAGKKAQVGWGSSFSGYLGMSNRASYCFVYLLG